jgi:aspartate aminotransferase
MLDHLKALPPDPILGILAAFKLDTNPRKIDLGIGVYKDENGETPMLMSVVHAEKEMIARQTSKTYLGPPGVTGFNSAISRIIFGEVLLDAAGPRIRTVQTPGGTGALRVAADLLQAANPGSTVWMSDPTWANHMAIFPASGLKIASYPYFDAQSSSLRFADMMASLAQLGPQDTVLFHACCHNPCGVSPTADQWEQITDLAAERGFMPLVDMAYQGFEKSLEDDNLAVRLFTRKCPELIVASSCSKNFAVYRDRVGAVSVVTGSDAQSSAVETVIHSLTRKNYSMPPAHGPAVIDIILHSTELESLWRDEVKAMRDRINGLRSELVKRIAAHLTALGIERDFSFLERQSGMFSFMGLTVEQVQALRDRFAIYTVNSARVNIASLNQGNMDYFVQSLASVLGDSNN